MTGLKIGVAVACLLAAGFLAVAANSVLRTPPVLQPLPFDHLKHTGELIMECTDCHKYVKEREFAGNPTLEICTDCHDEPSTETPAEAALLKYVEAKREIPWRRIYRVPSHVYYSHRRHVAVAKIECEVCHGAIGKSKTPPTKPLNDLTMDFCIECHERKSVSTDCNSCHR